MAVYEYECLTCGHNFEVWQKITADPIKSCERCGGEVRRLIGQTGFILKGSGWYVTDYVRKGKNDNPSKESNKEASSVGTKD
ncbi:MAG: zinc ribbon domain-containing protein [Caldimicrobium sp.]|nr:zinc ribbon domain-containing protein [Caldimicrobium sp.]MCX7613966.1 zinc ribbon domain-containing protein [Caldimicrobium sp.]MDW8182905.1 FmdB family zinc ribbon protein [Caldimicrobium sp.]